MKAYDTRYSFRSARAARQAVSWLRRPLTACHPGGAARGGRTVGKLVEATRLSQPIVSNHLSCLRECGLVTSAQQGRYVRYQLSDTRVAALMGLADDLVAELARGVYECTRYTREAQREERSAQ